MKVLDKNSANYMETLPKEYTVTRGKNKGKTYKTVKAALLDMTVGETAEIEMMLVDRNLPKESMSRRTHSCYMTIKK